MTAYDRWLEAPYQEAAERDDSIDAESERLLEDECNPENIDNFLDAISNECLEPVKEKLADAIQEGKGDFAEIGKIVWQAVYQYWRDQADSQAADRYNQGLIGDDRDYD